MRVMVIPFVVDVFERVPEDFEKSGETENHRKNNGSTQTTALLKSAEKSPGDPRRLAVIQTLVKD